MCCHYSDATAMCEIADEQYYRYPFAGDNESARLCVIVVSDATEVNAALSVWIANNFCNACDRSSALLVPRM